VYETAYAKVNLTLEVLGRRADGYHELRTILQTVDLADELTFTLGNDLRLECSTPSLSNTSNLVIRAARLLRETTGVKQGASIRLYKRIPVAVGLGGGSTDAAAALRGLNRLWELGLSRSDLEGLAAKLGSDVPFFVCGGTALVSGRGETVETLKQTPSFWLVLLVPHIEISGKTALMYSLLTKSNYTDGIRTTQLLETLKEGRVSSGHLFNCFEGVMEMAFEGIEEHIIEFREAGTTKVHLSGSGPGLFALVDNQTKGEEVVRRLHEGGYQALLQKSIGPIRP
jgi:4-diphosphocytidyl-2-C-methyl-D-erythritol kinase